MTKTRDAEAKAAPEVIEADAEVVESDLTTLSKSEEWLAQINERAELLAEQFRPHDIADEQDYKDSKKARADANREITAIEQERKNMTAAIKRAVREFEDGTRRAIEPLTLIVKQYDEKKGAYETRWTNERIATIREAYEDLAPDIALPQEGAEEALVPFHRLMGRYGNERGKGWTLRSVGEVKAIEAMQAAVEEIAKAEKTIESMVEEEYREGAKARYFRTLDLQATLNEEAEAKSQRERVARLEAERRAREEAERERERLAAEANEWLREKAAEPVPEGVVRVVAPPEPLPVEEPPYDYLPAEAFEPVPPAPPAPAAPEPPEPSIPWVIYIPSATRTQAMELAVWLSDHGMTGGNVFSGDMEVAYMKWRQQNAR